MERAHQRSGQIAYSFFLVWLGGFVTKGDEPADWAIWLLVIAVLASLVWVVTLPLTGRLFVRARTAWVNRGPKTSVGRSLAQRWDMLLWAGDDPDRTLTPARLGGDPWQLSFDCKGRGEERRFKLPGTSRATAISHPGSGNVVRTHDLPAVLPLGHEDGRHLELVRFVDGWLVLRDYGNPGSAVVLELDVPKGAE